MAQDRPAGPQWPAIVPLHAWYDIAWGYAYRTVELARLVGVAPLP